MSNRPFSLGAAAVAALLSACGGAGADADSSMPTLTVAASEYAFAMPESVAGGLVQVNFTNRGREEHHAQIIRLNDGVTREQFREVLAGVLTAVQTEGEGAYMRLFEVATVAGGPGMISPGREVGVVADLPAGEYALVCFVAGPDGVPHVVKDMVQYFSVAAPAAASAPAPVPTFSVDLADFAFSELPEVRAGRTVIEVRNSGPEPHEMIVLKLDGITLQQFMGMMASPPPADAAQPASPPYTSVGGVQALMPGGTGWVTLDLAPGNYAMVCFIPSPANRGAPHIMLGMSKEFTVGG
jgi:hypothetical protein